jgi:hypothetical protein
MLKNCGSAGFNIRTLGTDVTNHEGSEQVLVACCLFSPSRAHRLLLALGYRADRLVASTGRG